MRAVVLASLALGVTMSGAFAEEAARLGPRPLPAFPELDIRPPDLPPVVVIVEPERRAAQPAADLSPPDLPPAIVAIERPAVDLPPPDHPPVIVAVEPPAPPPAAAAPAIDLPPPDLPEIRVVIDAPKPQPATLLAETAQALQAIIEKEGPPAHPRLARALRDEIVAFYAGRAYAPLWIGAEGLAASGRAIAERLKLAEEEGLDPAAYPTPNLNVAADPAALAAAELRLSVSALIYARDARGGRIDARRLSNLIDPTLDMPGAAETFAALASAADAGAALRDFNPPHAGYRALRAKLREIRAAAERVASVPIPHGPVLRVGMSDARVALLRERLKIAPASDATYDAAVAEAVAGFQRERGLPANGALTRQTVAALSGPSLPQLEAEIIANMERWRWLPRDLGERHVIVNVPEYLVRVVDRGAVEHEARVIVGKPDTPTPIFSDAMQFLVVNPSWFVPPSILKKEFLPQLAKDPTYAERRGYQVIRRGGQISVRQPPGERNALGNIKFMFPNRHAVYLHDTPTRRLFAADRRAFSHGCVRVDQPLRLAEIVLGKENGWSEQRVRSLIGRGEQSVKLPRHLPIHLVYFTAFVDEDGRLQQRDDLYGHSRRVRAALGLEG